jgi:tetratricopeptide (TPR) repeat protein
MRPFFRIILASLCALLTVVAHAQTVEELVEKGNRLVQNGSPAEGIEYFNQALSLSPEYQDAFAKRAFAFILMRDYQRAIEDYTKLIDLNPALISAYLSRGSAFNKLERWQEALQDFNKVIELDPSNSEAFNNRGWSKKGMGDKDGACKDWHTSKKMGNHEAKIILKNNQC